MQHEEPYALIGQVRFRRGHGRKRPCLLKQDKLYNSLGGDIMKWFEVRELYPDKYVKFEVLDYNTVDHKDTLMI